MQKKKSQEAHVHTHARSQTLAGFDCRLFDSDGYSNIIFYTSAQEAIVEEAESDDSDSVQDVSGSQHVANIFLLDVKTSELVKAERTICL